MHNNLLFKLLSALNTICQFSYQPVIVLKSFCNLCSFLRRKPILSSLHY